MIIKNDRILPRPVLLAIAAVGWVFVVYLAWVVFYDSYNRSSFVFATLAGAPGLPEDPFNQRYVDQP